ncbi:MAG: outer membrane beta-barrel protein [Paludibacteraceae bacterium]|nr:outer membrane beta-barrel protein [Paludibacteraceae bacterium]
MKRVLLLALLLSGTMLFAQQTGSIQGTVVDSQSGQIMEMVAVQLFAYSGTDSTMVGGAQTDMEGFFYFMKLKPGKYKLVLSSLGYHTRIIPVELTEEKMIREMGNLRLAEDVQALAEIDVKGHAAEMTVKGDTIEYNTAAYKMEETAVVEDLLKKMSGVQVDKEGNVTVNGETIKAVRVDGKKFFGDDVQTATKNIPADMIEKIQVLDEKSETSKMTGFDDDETSRVINLTLKSDRKQGLFGNFNGGLGADLVTDDGKWFNYGNPAFGATAGERTKHFFENDFRYSAGVFMNILSGNSQSTVIGNANNTNEIRMGRGRGSWGTQNQGITWAENIGVNTNIDVSGSVPGMLLGGDGQLAHSNNYTTTLSNKNTYTSGTNYLQDESSNSKSNTWDANVRLEMEYEIDSMNKVLIQPQFSYTDSWQDAYNEYTNGRYAEGTDTTVISDGNQTKNSTSRDITGKIQVIYTHSFLKPGRKLTLTANANITDTKGHTDTYAFDNLGDSILVNQYTNSGNTSVGYSLRASYIEPLYKKEHLLEIAVLASGNNRTSKKDQYDIGLTDTTYNDDYSNHLLNDFYTEQLEANYQWKHEKFNLTVGVKGLLSQTRSRTYYGSPGAYTLKRDTLLNVFNISPNINFRYKFGKKKFARIRYNGTTQQPSITQLEPVRNNSDAMYETVGNLSLNPAFKHSLHLMYSTFNQDLFWSLMTGLHGNLTKDALVGNTIYDETGKRYQQTVNATDAPYDLSADLMFNTPFANKMMQFNTRTSISYNQRVSYISREHTATEIAAMIAANNLALGDKSLTGNLQVSENLTLRLTHDIVDVGVVGSFNYSRTHNNLSADAITNVFNWSVTGDINFNLPKSWTIGADCGYTARYGYGFDDPNEIILNASISKSWSNATLTLKAYDLLNQKKNIVQVVGENYVQYKEYNTLGTYAMLTFTYKLNRMGSLKAKGMAGHIQEMMETGQTPGQPGKGGMPPMGPPPDRPN